MSYATAAELKAFIGTTAGVNAISDADLGTILTQAYNEINARLEASGVSIPASSATLKTAELMLGKNPVVTRAKIDGTLTDAEGSAGNYAVYDIDSSIYVLHTRAIEIVDDYVVSQKRLRQRAYKVN